MAEVQKSLNEAPARRRGMVRTYFQQSMIPLVTAHRCSQAKLGRTSSQRWCDPSNKGVNGFKKSKGNLDQRKSPSFRSALPACASHKPPPRGVDVYHWLYAAQSRAGDISCSARFLRALQTLHRARVLFWTRSPDAEDVKVSCKPLWTCVETTSIRILAKLHCILMGSRLLIMFALRCLAESLPAHCSEIW